MENTNTCVLGESLLLLEPLSGQRSGMYTHTHTHTHNVYSHVEHLYFCIQKRKKKNKGKLVLVRAKALLFLLLSDAFYCHHLDNQEIVFHSS